MIPYRTLLNLLIGFTIGGVISYFLFGTFPVYTLLSLYSIICFVLIVEFYLEERSEDKND